MAVAIPYIPEAVVALGEALGVTAGVTATAELLKKQQKNISNIFCIGTALVVGEAYSIFHSNHKTTSVYSNPYANGQCVADNTRVKTPINTIVSTKTPVVTTKTSINVKTQSAKSTTAAQTKAKTQATKITTNVVKTNAKNETIKAPTKTKTNTIKTASTSATSTSGTNSSSTNSTSNNTPKGNWKVKKGYIFNILITLGFDISDLEDAYNEGEYGLFFSHLAIDLIAGYLGPLASDQVKMEGLLGSIKKFVAWGCVDGLGDLFNNLADLLLKNKDNPEKLKEITENFEDTLIMEEEDANTLCNDYGFDNDMLQKCFEDGYTPHKVLNEIVNGLDKDILINGWKNGKTTKEIIESIDKEEEYETSSVNETNKQTLDLVA